MAIEEEIRELERRFADSPESRLFLPLADSLRRAGELERAVRICSRGLESYPDFTSARVLLALCLMELGHSIEAAEQFDLVLAQDSENLEALKGLGSLAAERGEGERAREYFQHALEIEPQDEDVLVAVKAFEPVAPGDASTQLEESPLTGAGEVFITHTLGDIFRLQGHYQRAYEVYRRLLERTPGDKILASKLNEVAGHLEGKAPEVYPQPKNEETAVTVVHADNTSDGQSRDEVTRRIDSIFESVLNDPSETEAMEQENSPGSFVNMFERWIKSLRLLEAG